MRASENFKKIYQRLQNSIGDSIKHIVGNRSLDLNNGLVIATYDDINECIVTIHEDLTVDTDFNHDVMIRGSKIEDFPIHIQIALLEMLEDEDYTINDDE